MIDKTILQHKDAWKNPDIYKEVYDFSVTNPEEYWMSQIDRLSWTKLPQTPSQLTENGNTLWFPDGEINACYNCVDRHFEKNPDKTAIIWQSENIDVFEKFSFRDLKNEVCKFANTLKKLGLTRDDCITIYMPMVPEGMFACLACARLGIPYSAVFAGFSPNAMSVRMNDCNSNFIISVDAHTRGGKLIQLKDNIDKARKICNRDIRALIVRRKGIDIQWDSKLDLDYREESVDQSTDCPIAKTNSTSDLFVLYTSGSVGKPKGIVIGTGGYTLFSLLTQKYFFDMHDESVFWGSGDIGWLGGHSYGMYGPLSNGATTLIFEGIPTYPRPSIFWEVVDKHKVTSFSTAPTALRAMMKDPDASISGTTRDSLEVIGVMGEVLNREAWNWYFHKVGKGKIPLINMWGQTELGGVTTAPLCNLEDMKTFGHVGRQLFGCKFVIKDDNNYVITTPDKNGLLFIEHSMPGMLNGVFGDKDAVKKLYYSQASYCTGDEAYFDRDNNFWITGRVDDVLNVSGHRISPIEIEEVVMGTGIVSETSVVGYPHKIKGEGICAFVVLKAEISEDDRANAHQIITNRVRDIISPISKPDVIVIVSDLPKTRSGKIMKRILRKIMSGPEAKGSVEDITTISNPECLDEIRRIVESNS